MHTFLGYEIPMPAEDLYVALTAVTCFLPAVYLTHWTIVYLARLLPKSKRA